MRTLVWARGVTIREWLRANIEWSTEESEKSLARVSRTIRDLARSEDGSRSATIFNDATSLSACPYLLRLRGDESMMQTSRQSRPQRYHEARPELEAQGNLLCVLRRCWSRHARAMRFNWHRPYKDLAGLRCSCGSLVAFQAVARSLSDYVAK